MARCPCFVRVLHPPRRLDDRPHPPPVGLHRPERLGRPPSVHDPVRSEEHTSELQSHSEIVCRLLLEKKNQRESVKNDKPTISMSLSHCIHQTLNSKASTPFLFPYTTLFRSVLHPPRRLDDRPHPPPVGLHRPERLGRPPSVHDPV